MTIDATVLVYLGLLAAIFGGIWFVNYIESEEYERKRRRGDAPEE